MGGGVGAVNGLVITLTQAFPSLLNETLWSPPP